ncbi:MAG: hypothetical protein COA74_13955 [Gammaproteobacteria bacterium]|nr:MAG: hypothetical protein COA74_13955 [Gammaproteobacteria bacterium]
MIDFARVHLPLLHLPIRSGEVVSIGIDGEVEWCSPKLIQVVGSDDSRIFIKSVGGNGEGMATELWCHFNPSKVLQGHNVFGSDDFVALIYNSFIKFIMPQFDLKPTIEEMFLIKSGDYPICMVDINYSFELPSRADVRAFIRAAEYKSKTRHGRPSTKGGTLYYGKTSERWALKMYSKGDEISRAKGKIPSRIANIGIEQWADNKLRVELRLHKKELTKLDIPKAKDLSIDRVRALFNEYVRRIDMSEQIMLTDETMMNMPNKLRSTYTLWKEGHDLRNLMSRTTHHRHRKELYNAYGINIDLRSESIKASNVVPLIRILEAKPAEIPLWAYEKGLVHHSTPDCWGLRNVS